MTAESSLDAPSCSQLRREAQRAELDHLRIGYRDPHDPRGLAHGAALEETELEHPVVALGKPAEQIRGSTRADAAAIIVRAVAGISGIKRQLIELDGVVLTPVVREDGPRCGEKVRAHLGSGAPAETGKGLKEDLGREVLGIGTVARASVDVLVHGS